MLIFRIEDKNGNGPYSSSWNYYRSIQKLNGTNQPSPYYECIKFKCEQHKFGFIDLNQYQEWFNEKWRFKFKKHNFRLNVYKVFKKDVLFGKRQIAFDFNKAKFIKSLDPMVFTNDLFL